jgi:hypothetical protein
MKFDRQYTENWNLTCHLLNLTCSIPKIEILPVTYWIWHAVYRKLKSYLSPIKFDLLIWKIFPYNRTITWWNLMNIGINELKLMSNCWHQGHGDQTGAVTHDLPQLRLACFTTNVVNLRKKNYFIYKTVTILQSLYLNGFQIYILKET